MNGDFNKGICMSMKYDYNMNLKRNKNKIIDEDKISKGMTKKTRISEYFMNDTNDKIDKKKRNGNYDKYLIK